MYGLQLERTDLSHGDTILWRLRYFQCIRVANITHYKGLLLTEMSFHDLTGQCGGGSLAVSAGNGDHSALLRKESQFDLSQDLYPAVPHTVHQRNIRRYSGA